VLAAICSLIKNAGFTDDSLKLQTGTVPILYRPRAEIGRQSGNFFDENLDHVMRKNRGWWQPKENGLKR
jgi:hypothetical protein